MEKDLSTEEKIKEAARKIFQQKGYAGAKTRDIAEEAGINLALLNYYYRSKERLFELVMEESLIELFSAIKMLLNEPITDSAHTLSKKIDTVVNVYLNILLENPNLPIFVLSEIQANPNHFREKIGLSDSFVNQTYLYKQLQAQLQIAEMEDINPMHFIVNILSMCIFPFISKPVLMGIGNMNETAFQQFIEERRVLIPIWIKQMLKLQ